MRNAVKLFSKMWNRARSGFQRVLESETYIFDLEQANIGGELFKPIYYRLYDAKTDLGMENLFPADWDDLARRMATDDELFAKFERWAVLVFPICKLDIFREVREIISTNMSTVRRMDNLTQEVNEADNYSLRKCGM